MLTTRFFYSRSCHHNKNYYYYYLQWIKCASSTLSMRKTVKNFRKLICYKLWFIQVTGIVWNSPLSLSLYVPTEHFHFFHNFAMAMERKGIIVNMSIGTLQRGMTFFLHNTPQTLIYTNTLDKNYHFKVQVRFLSFDKLSSVFTQIVSVFNI